MLDLLQISQTKMDLTIEKLKKVRDTTRHSFSDSQKTMPIQYYCNQTNPLKPLSIRGYMMHRQFVEALYQETHAGLVEKGFNEDEAHYLAYFSLNELLCAWCPRRWPIQNFEKCYNINLKYVDILENYSMEEKPMFSEMEILPPEFFKIYWGIINLTQDPHFWEYSREKAEDIIKSIKQCTREVFSKYFK